VNDLARIGILRELTGKRRDRLFSYERYLALFLGATDKN
jgi:hypothetical protein